MNTKRIAELLGKIQQAAYYSNLNTNYAVFVDYAGHVDRLDVRILKSKDGYSKLNWKEQILYSEHFYLFGELGADAEEELTALLELLKSLPYEPLLDQEGETK